MTDLVTRLRALADEHKHTLVGWEQRLVATLGEAADALDRLHHSRVPTGSLMAEVRELEQELDALKAKLAVEARYVAEYREAYCKEVARAEKAEAEAAEFRELLKEMRDLADKDGYLSRILSVKVIDQALSQPGPGASYQARMRKLERVLEIANQLGCRITAEGGHGLPVHALVLDLAEAVAPLKEKP